MYHSKVVNVKSDNGCGCGEGGGCIISCTGVYGRELEILNIPTQIPAISEHDVPKRGSFAMDGEFAPFASVTNTPNRNV